MQDQELLDSNKEQHPFFIGLIPKWTIYESNNQHRAAAAATVAVAVAAVAAQNVVSCSKLGA